MLLQVGFMSVKHTKHMSNTVSGVATVWAAQDGPVWHP